MSRGHRPQVLVVDDNAAVRELYAAVLGGEYDVLTVGSGEAALDLMDGSIDAVLLDRRMPGLSGDETLERLRTRGHDCPVAMVTAIDPDVDVGETQYDAYAIKPLGRDELLEVVAGLLHREDPDPGSKRGDGEGADLVGRFDGS